MTVSTAWKADDGVRSHDTIELLVRHATWDEV